MVELLIVQEAHKVAVQRGMEHLQALSKYPSRRSARCGGGGSLDPNREAWRSVEPGETPALGGMWPWFCHYLLSASGVG